ncbi:hypothetical protein QZH41_016864 [Actinostola sp. cb2023]|nr:hypothetical protein QZH41_016864 [Actinostola sp. cb2023]
MPSGLSTKAIPQSVTESQELNSDDSHSNPDQFGIAKRIIETPGPFVTIRMACRLAHCTSSSAVAAMEKLSKEKVGTLDDNMKCFFKSAPLTVCEDSLELYGVDIVRYSEAFRSRSQHISDRQWNVLMANAPQHREVQRYFAA